MPTHIIRKPDTYQQHQWRFSREEVIGILTASLEKPTPEGDKALWGLESGPRGEQHLTLIIDEELNVKQEDKENV